MSKSLKSNVTKKNIWPHIISLVASILIGLDIFVFFYLFSFQIIGVVPAIFISFCGFLLNTYLYYVDGPVNLIDFWSSTDKSFWSRIFDLISFMGGLLIFIFTYYVYAQMVMIYPSLAIWFTPFLVTVMACADGIGTLTMNKSGFLQLLQAYAIDDYRDAFKIWWEQFKLFFLRVLLGRKRKFDKWSIYRVCKYILIPVGIGVIVTFSFTRTYLLGSLILVRGTVFTPILVPLLWACAAAFFVGELYFVCQQNIDLIYDLDKPKKSSIWNYSIFFIDILIVCNAVASGFVALESSLLAVTTWGLVRFMATCMQYHFVIKNKCNKFLSFDEMHGFATYPVVKNTALVLICLLIVYIAQTPFAFMPFAMFGPLPALVVLFAFTIFFGITAMVLMVFDDPKIRVNTPKSIASQAFNSPNTLQQTRKEGPPGLDNNNFDDDDYDISSLFN